MINSNLDLQITVKANDRYDIDLGSLRLHNGNKSYFLDIVNSYSDDETGVITIDCELENDEIENIEIFGEDSFFDLTDADLFEDTASATVWVEGDDEEFEIISMVLNITHAKLGKKTILCMEE
jgi:hypothetical protein